MEILGFWLAEDDEGVGLDRSVDFWSVDVKDGVVVLEEVNLINSLQWLAAEFFDDLLNLGVVSWGIFSNNLVFADNRLL